MSTTDISKFISLILRHKPSTINITLDKHGWANVEELIKGISKTHNIDMAMLEEIVFSDEKQRYSFNEDKTLIRANQGHSFPVDMEFEVTTPPKYLYHGTGEKYIPSIETYGLISKSRLYVHLSSDFDTAQEVGSRHGKPVVYKISSYEMANDGYKFYKSVNGIWLTKEVPYKYLMHNSFNWDTLTEVVRSLRKAFTDNNNDLIENTIIPKYTWEYVQQALFKILLDDNSPAEEYNAVADIFWSAVLDKRKIDKTTTIALLYYRLGNIDSPYDNNTIWSIASNLLDLDYANSEYNPLKDKHIIKQLTKYGIAM